MVPAGPTPESPKLSLVSMGSLWLVELFRTVDDPVEAKVLSQFHSHEPTSITLEKVYGW